MTGRTATKLFIVLLLSVVLMAFTQCVVVPETTAVNFNAGSVRGPASSNLSPSVAAFEKTVYKITSTKCVGCHTSTAPTHASPNVISAHDSIVTSKINWSNVSSSRLVAKLRDEFHNCWGDCGTNALEIETAIIEWKDALSIKDPESPEPPIEDNVVGYITPNKRALSVELADPRNIKGLYELDLSQATLTSPMVRQTENGRTVLATPEAGRATQGAGVAGAGKAVLRFNFPEAGTYGVYIETLAPTTNANEFYISIPTYDSSNTIKTLASVSPSVSAWTSHRNIRITKAGAHQIVLQERKDGLKIRRVVVVSNPTIYGSATITANPSALLPILTGAEPPATYGTTLTYDVSSEVGSPGVKFMVDVEDFDQYTVKLSNPRISTPSTNVYVHSIRPVINDYYNVQHSGYSLIDKVASPEDGKLATNSLMILKDKGNRSDVYAFNFEVLELTGNLSPVEYFSNTVYQVSRSNKCMECHRTTSPQHASDVALTAFNAVSAANLVNLTTPANSAIVAKMKSNHSGSSGRCGDNGASDCARLADEYIRAITTWKRDAGL